MDAFLIVSFLIRNRHREQNDISSPLMTFIIHWLLAFCWGDDRRSGEMMRTEPDEDNATV